MALDARIKPALARAGMPTPLGTNWRALCGKPMCRGVLGHLGYREDDPYGGGDERIALAPVWLILLAAYVQHEPGVWRPGKHARGRHDLRPRRPRYSRAPSTARASRLPSGDILLPEGLTPCVALLMRRGAAGVHRAAAAGSYGATGDPDTQLVPVAYGDVLTIECPVSDCRAPSRLVIPTHAELIAAPKRKRGERGHPA